MWLFERQYRSSEKNGPLTIRRRFGRWQVCAKGYQQSGERLNAIWRDAFKRVREDVVAKPKALLLGLGAGGIVKELHKAFAGALVKAVEYDATMIALAKELNTYAPHPAPEIIYADALHVVPNLREQFDLIVVDIFSGNEPSPLLADKIFLAALKEKLAQKGVLLVNVCSNTHFLEEVQKFFPVLQRWQYKLNTLGAFRLSL